MFLFPFLGHRRSLTFGQAAAVDHQSFLLQGSFPTVFLDVADLETTGNTINDQFSSVLWLLVTQETTGD